MCELMFLLLIRMDSASSKSLNIDVGTKLAVGGLILHLLRYVPGMIHFIYGHKFWRFRQC